MEPTASFNDLLARLNQGDASAGAEIFHRFAGRLVGLASSRLAGAIRQKVDAEDLVQSAFKSFFRANAQAPFELHDWNSLWSLLAAITLRKLGYQVRQYLTEKRNVRQEVAKVRAGDDSGSDWTTLAREPTPAEAAVFAETLEHLLNDLEEKPRQIVELSLQGLTPSEIAERAGLTERTVYRQLERFRQRLHQSCQE